MVTFAKSFAASVSASSRTSPRTSAPPTSPRAAPYGAGAWLAAYALLLCAFALALPALSLPAHYHDFADQVAWGVLPHARDVLSNAAFAVAGAVLLGRVRGLKKQLPSEAALALCISGWGLVLTALCSGIYHLRPDTAGLALDRAGMVVAFAGMVGVLVQDRLPHTAARPVMAVAVLLGMACVLADGLHGNMTPWVLYQAGAAGLMLLLPMCRFLLPASLDQQKGRWGIAWWQVLAFYALAKAVEMADHPIWHYTGGLFSGHNLKHVVAACAVLPVLWALGRIQKSNTPKVF